MTQHRSGAREHADPVAGEEEPGERGDEALEDVEHGHRDAERLAVGAPDVRRADVAAPLLPDVLAAGQPHHDDAGRDRADQVPGEDEERVGEHGASLRGDAAGDGHGGAVTVTGSHDGISYAATQPLTTPQSRFSKNASTYEARSVW